MSAYTDKLYMVAQLSLFLLAAGVTLAQTDWPVDIGNVLYFSTPARDLFAGKPGDSLIAFRLPKEK
ncbi:MAG TPA: hypothetical protein VH477_14505 [Bryobacteraceae bacterium]